MKTQKTIGFLLVALAFPVFVSAGVLVWNNNTLTFTDPESSITVDSAYSVTRALENSGVWGVYESDSLPDDLSVYNAVFVLMGAYPMDGNLSVDEQDRLVEYLDFGGNLYIEGGDFGNDYQTTSLFYKTGAEFKSDGRFLDEGNVDILDGINGSPVEGYSFVYHAYQTELPDNYVDELDTSPSYSAQILFTSRKAPVVSNMRAIFNDLSLGGNVYYSTFIFGSLEDGSAGNTKDALMGEIINMLNIEVSIQPTSLGHIKSLFR